MKPIEFPLIRLSTSGNVADVIFAEFPANLRVDIDAARLIVSKRLNFAGNKKHFLVLDMSNVRGVTAEARKYMQEPDGGLKNILGAALIASNPVSALIANIFVKTSKDFDAKFFSNKEAAFEWVYRQRQKALG
jgi:hypothetical protein